MKRTPYFLVTCLAIVLAACGKNVKTQLVAAWKLDANAVSQFMPEEPKQATDDNEGNRKKDAPIIGKWNLIMADGKKMTEKDNATFEFRKDGTFKQVRGKATRKGEWEVSKDKKSIKIMPQNSKSEKMVITKFKDNRLTFTDGVKDAEFILEKAEGGEESDSEVATKKKMPEEGVLEFRKDGSYVFSAGKVTTNGKWEVAEDNKSVKLIPEKGISDNLAIVKIDEKEFTFRGSKATADAVAKKR